VRPVQESRPNRGDLDTERTLGLPGLRGEYWAWDDSPDAGRLALSVAPRLQLIDSRRNRELGVFDVRSGGSDSVDTTTPVGQAASRQFCLAPFASTYDRGDDVTALVQEESRRERQSTRPLLVHCGRVSVDLRDARDQAIAKAEAVRGNVAWLVRTPHTVPMQTPGQEGPGRAPARRAIAGARRIDRPPPGVVQDE
jgi:hypothetical protein